ncbi:MAG TPA: MMPL family transporter, partial [Acidimicrobiia bacterium]|nr:MMPL family transporter [Acidimicrobiia bacterium]
MRLLIRFLSTAVRRAPVAVLVGSIVLTAVFGYFVPKAQRAVGNEGFAPDSPEFAALLTIDDVFSEQSEVAVQVLVGGSEFDVLTADGLRSYVLARQAIADSRASELMVGRPSGDIVGFFDPLLDAYAEAGLDPMATDDATVKQVFSDVLASLPPEFTEQFTGLLSTNADLDAATSPAGLMVVFLNLAVLEDDPDQAELQAIQLDMADGIRAATEGQAVPVEPFSFALLFADQSEFEAEIGRLFGIAFLIILGLLAFVFWIKPRGRLKLGGSIRRTAADVLLALGVIIMSITWMNGIGVLLGPGYLGIIGPFSEFLQIIPILLIGLGVDYAIHLTSRYREEVGGGASVVEAAVRASRTVGVALVLATVTTAVGFLTNIFSPVTAIADFGIMVAVGITSAFVLMLTFVPSIRILLDRRAERAGRFPTTELGHTSSRLLPRMMGATSVVAARIPAIMVTVAVVLAGLGAYGWSKLDTRFSFIDFVPEGSTLLVTYETIVEEFGGGFGERTQVLVEGDVATPAAHNALGLAHQAMGDTPFVLTFSGRAQAESPLSVLYFLTTPPEAGGEPDLYDPGFLATAMELGLNEDLSVRPDADVAAIYALAEAAQPEAMRRVLAAEDGVYRYIDVSVATQAGEGGASQLRTGLRNAFSPLEALTGVTATPTNEFIVSALVVEAIQSSQIGSLFLTLGVAMLLLAVNFGMTARRPGLGIITMLPVVFVVLWVFGMMKLVGLALNPVTAMIASISIGIGVPYTIHITHRYQEDRARASSSEEA